MSNFGKHFFFFWEGGFVLFWGRCWINHQRRRKRKAICMVYGHSNGQALSSSPLPYLLPSEHGAYYNPWFLYSINNWQGGKASTQILERCGFPLKIQSHRYATNSQLHVFMIFAWFKCVDILFLHIKILFSASENIIIVLQFFFPLKIKKKRSRYKCSELPWGMA